MGPYRIHGGTVSALPGAETLLWEGLHAEQKPNGSLRRSHGRPSGFPEGGIILALEIAEEEEQKKQQKQGPDLYRQPSSHQIISQAKGKSGSYLLQTIADKTQKFQEQGVRTEIRWVPAHTGIQGNEDTDTAAKEATGWRQNGETGA
ncbi:hypothetical protein LY76DRAFT_609599 [Colletotrichum caudatum]|nr:hypothetical protein LY76DRAFT_609599 [Colletotrichum caudatum]